MDGNNLYPVGLFIEKLDHPRKQELATMLIEGTTIEAVTEAGYNRVIVLEMCREIKRNVIGMADFDFEYPRNPEDAIVTPGVVNTIAEEEALEINPIIQTEETVVTPEIVVNPEVTINPEVTDPANANG